MHDGLLFQKGKEREVYEIMSSIFLKHLGTVPVMTLNSKKIYSINDIDDIPQ